MFGKKINVLILPAGSRIAIGAIKTLVKEKNINVVSADIDKLAPGLYLSHKKYLISSFLQEQKFWTDIKKIIKKEKIDIVIPALDPILIKFSGNKKFFENLGTKVLVSCPETIFLTRDKWQTYNIFKDSTFFPKSWIEKEKIDMPLPLFIKPRDGSGSINALKVESREDLDFYFKKIKNPIVQEYLDGKEYTVDCLADLDGKFLNCVARERMDTKAGVSVKGQVVKNAEIKKIAKKICEKIKFKGPFFFQLKEKNGKFMVLEINVRFGGGMPLTVEAGLNIYLLSLKLFLEQKIKLPKIKYGLYFTRYDEEIYLDKSKIIK